MGGKSTVLPPGEIVCAVDCAMFDELVAVVPATAGRAEAAPAMLGLTAASSSPPGAPTIAVVRRGRSTPRARLQELGPRFTMRLRWLQEGTFDTVAGEYEWFHRRKEMDTSRRKFHL